MTDFSLLLLHWEKNGLQLCNKIPDRIFALNIYEADIKNQPFVRTLFKYSASHACIEPIKVISLLEVSRYINIKHIHSL